MILVSPRWSIHIRSQWLVPEKTTATPQPQLTNYNAKAEKEGVPLGETTAHTSGEIKCLFWPKNE